MSDRSCRIKEEEPTSPLSGSAFAVASSTNTDTTSSPDNSNITTNSSSNPSYSEASGGGQRAKRARTSKPKVKTGCTNCKQRRIKCDEARPSCTQCVRSNKACTGYPPPSRSSRPFEEIRIAPKPIATVASQPAPGPVPLQREVVLPPRRVRHKVPRTASPQSLSRHVPSATTYQPSLNLPFQPTEGLYFGIFRAQTANELSGYFDSTFWTRRVLQECHTEAAIRHAVVALGALYQTLEQTAEASHHTGSSPSPQTETALGHWQVAVKQYSEACNALVLLNNQDQQSHKTLIMASVLLACFDSFIGDHKQAIIQIQNGLGLLERLRAKGGKQLTPAPEDSLEQDLVTMFTRLAIQAKSYDMAFHFPQPFVIRLTPQSQDGAKSETSSEGSSPKSEASWAIPERFTSLLEARTASDKLSERILRFIEGLFAAKTDLKGTLPQSWRDFGLEFKTQLDAWSDAFDHIFHSRTNPSVSPQEKAGIAALKMLQINSQVLFLMMFSDKESQFDMFLHQFQAIVDLGLEVVADEEGRAAAERCPDRSQCRHRQGHADTFSIPGFSAPHIKPSFSADLGIVPPLFVVATKCRDPVTRRQAIQLLRSSARREAMWDSELAAHIATWVMNVEESETQALDLQAGELGGQGSSMPSTIPEEKRVMIRSVDFDLRARFADLQVGTRGLQPGLPDSKFHQTHITW
ncbi:Fc.00g052110.m01.CDS01 [Cosmosporella sp. VM-42]